MVNGTLPLYYLCSVAGFIMVAGGIWLIYKQKIYIDKESKQVTEIETPFGKFKTNIPALALFILGFIPLIYPLIKLNEINKQLTIVGNVKSNSHPVEVCAVLDSDILNGDGDFKLNVPTFSQGYKVIYVANNVVLDDRVDLQKREGDKITMAPKNIKCSKSSQDFEVDIIPVPNEFK
jgi:hypothetical protein